LDLEGDVPPKLKIFLDKFIMMASLQKEIWLEEERVLILYALYVQVKLKQLITYF